MTRTISTKQARQLDARAIEEFCVPSVVLMENAGRGAAERLLKLNPSGPVVICCGPGNNGGDGFVVARHLDLRGIAVRIVLLADPAKLKGDAEINHRIADASGIPIERSTNGDIAGQLAGSAWIVDALLGTGASGQPRPPFDAAIRAMNASGIPILAIDSPSGLDCDNGQAATHTVRAAHTCTFVAVKTGFLAQGANEYTGQLHVVDIGAPRKLVEAIVGPDRP